MKVLTMEQKYEKISEKTRLYIKAKKLEFNAAWIGMMNNRSKMIYDNAPEEISVKESVIRALEDWYEREMLIRNEIATILDIDSLNKGE